MYDEAHCLEKTIISISTLNRFLHTARKTNCITLTGSTWSFEVESIFCQLPDEMKQFQFLPIRGSLQLNFKDCECCSNCSTPWSNGKPFFIKQSFTFLKRYNIYFVTKRHSFFVERISSVCPCLPYKNKAYDSYTVSKTRLDAVLSFNFTEVCSTSNHNLISDVLFLQIFWHITFLL